MDDDDHDELRRENEAFYAAFRARDTEAMEERWAESSPVSCIHPGWDVLHGREAVLTSWRRILANPGAPPIVCSEVETAIHEGCGIVICREGIEDHEAGLIATNVFVREGSGWRLVHHQAGPVSAPTPPEPDRTLN